jgi:glycosyltransferase involved in cell wall biosynthesis
MNTPKIIILGDTFIFGGAEYYVVNTITLLEKAMICYYRVAGKELAEKLKANNSNISLFKSKKYWEKLKEVKLFIKEKQADIVILNGGQHIMFFTPFIRKTKKIIIRHSTNICVKSKLKRIVYILSNHIAYFFSDLIIHVSEYSLYEQKLFKRKAVCIHNGVNNTPIIARTIRKPIKFLFCGRTDIYKGIDIIVQAFQHIPKEKGFLNIVGTGAYAEQLCKINEPNIKYYGFQSDVDKYYYENDVFILLSDCENCSFAIIDALRSSMPIITTGMGGISEMVFNNKNGLIIDKKTDSLVSAINTLIENPEMIVTMGIESRKIFEADFTIEKNISQLTQAINNII